MSEPSRNDAVLAARGLSVGYGGRHPTVVLSDVNAELQGGRCVALLGPNGSGKSTLLRTLAGLQRPLAGEVLLDGTDIARLSAGEVARVLSVVLTDAIDAAQLSAWDVVALGRAPHAGFTGRLAAADREVVRGAFVATASAHLAARPLQDLSDGERQRVLIARALAQEPRLILLDEPTAFLDLEARADIAQLLRELAHGDEAQRRAIVITTHDFDLAVQMADELWLIRQMGCWSAGVPTSWRSRERSTRCSRTTRCSSTGNRGASTCALGDRARRWGSDGAALERRAGGVGALRLTTPCPVAQLVERAAVNR